MSSGFHLSISEYHTLNKRGAIPVGFWRCLSRISVSGIRKASFVKDIKQGAQLQVTDCAFPEMVGSIESSENHSSDSTEISHLTSNQAEESERYTLRVDTC